MLELGVVDIGDFGESKHHNEEYLEEVADVDDEAVWAGLDSDPLIVNVHLETGNLVLMEDGEQMGISVRSQADGELRLRARRVQIEAH